MIKVFKNERDGHLMASKQNLSMVAVAVLVVATLFGIDLKQQNTDSSQTQHDQSAQNKNLNTGLKADSSKVGLAEAPSYGVGEIAQAFEAKRGDIQVQAEGRVTAVLKDDNQGTRHQKFILTLENGQTVLVAHNIDLAPRIEHLTQGDIVEFYGEYEYSAQGGVIHWTHRDPQNRHIDGWLKHQGKIYQ